MLTIKGAVVVEFLSASRENVSIKVEVVDEKGNRLSNLGHKSVPVGNGVNVPIEFVLRDENGDIIGEDEDYPVLDKMFREMIDLSLARLISEMNVLIGDRRKRLDAAKKRWGEEHGFHK